MAWIEHTKGGGLRMVDRVKVNGKYKRVSVVLPKDTPQARKKAIEALLERSRQIAQEDEKGPDMKLSEAIEDYLELKDCRESTKQALRSYFKNVTTFLGDVPLHSITPAMIRRAFYKSDKGAGIVNRALVTLRTFCDWCVAMEYLPTNPAKDVKPLKVEKEPLNPADLYLEADQLKVVLNQTYGMAHYVTHFLALTGMRIGEASALTLEDVGATHITVNKAYSYTTGTITKPKNATSIRQVFIQPELREMLNEYMQWRNIDMMAYGLRPKTLFYSRNGGIYSEILLLRALKPHGLHPHTLRHTHVALLAEKGMSLEAIARRIGHNGTETTRAVYYHVTQKQREKDEQAMAAVRIL